MAKGLASKVSKAFEPTEGTVVTCLDCRQKVRVYGSDSQKDRSRSWIKVGGDDYCRDCALGALANELKIYKEMGKQFDALVRAVLELKREIKAAEPGSGPGFLISLSERLEVVERELKQRALPLS